MPSQDADQAERERDVAQPVDPGLWSGPRLSRRLRYDQMVPPIPIGTDTRKTSRQSTAASTPPGCSPMKEPEIAGHLVDPHGRARAGLAGTRR